MKLTLKVVATIVILGVGWFLTDVDFLLLNAPSTGAVIGGLALMPIVIYIILKALRGIWR